MICVSFAVKYMCKNAYAGTYILSKLIYSNFGGSKLLFNVFCCIIHKRLFPRFV